MTFFYQMLRASVAATVLGTATLVAGSQLAYAQSVLRVVPQADLKNLDPVWTTAIITSNHGYMVYDVLFAMDRELKPQPQMVDTYERSADGLLWTFKLREGLTFHDGSPVEALDAVLSLKRWAARMSAGQTLFNTVDDVVATGPLTFEIRFKSLFGPVLEALANPGNPAVIMREEEALTDPYEQIKEVVGSGPYIFKRDEWEPGHKVVYVKNEAYRPRPEPASGFAGGKLAHFDRVEWIYVPDSNTATQALLTGKVDILDKPPPDLLPLMEQSPDVTTEVINKLGFQGMIRPNHLIPPFDNPKARQALLYLVGDQTDHLAAMVGNRALETPCWAVMVCGTPLGVDNGIGEWNRPDHAANLEKAKQLLSESGYNGEPIVLMDPTDFEVIHNMSIVTAQKLRDAGVNVDLQAMDWSTLTSRRPVKKAPDQDAAGYHLFHTYSPGGYAADPLANGALGSSCDQSNWFGWPCDDELEKMRLEFITVAPEKRVDLARRYQRRYYEVVPYVPLGQFLAPIAYRSDLTGILEAERLILWNIQRKQ
ncbi:MAG: ABC transporter substrate-binding protein [Gammaproteobacteria bacterium]